MSEADIIIWFISMLLSVQENEYRILKCKFVAFFNFLKIIFKLQFPWIEDILFYLSIENFLKFFTIYSKQI